MYSEVKMDLSFGFCDGPTTTAKVAFCVGMTSSQNGNHCQYNYHQWIVWSPIKDLDLADRKNGPLYGQHPDLIKSYTEMIKLSSVCV